MSMFQRKARDGEEDQVLDGDPAAPHPGSVGHLLRSTRESHGWDLRDVAGALRIRTDYLEALERNTVEGLPGVAYATGFLRAYADYLGLDGNEAVRRFKTEKKTLASRPELSFPVPLTDRGIPGSGLFLIAVLLVALAYGTWYYMSSGEHPTPPAVEPVPARLLNPPQAEAPIVNPGAATEAAGSQAVGSQAAGTDAAAPAAATPDAAPSAPTPRPTTASTPVSPSQTATSPTTSTAAAPTAPAPTSTAPAQGTSPAPGVQPSIGAPQLAAAPTVPTTTPAVPPESAAPTDPKAPKSYGAVDAPGRILVKATGYAWVQVYDGKEPILTRTLRPGDSYYVPAKPGLIMRTGNAGGLAFVVDGKELPPLGPTGMVKKRIPLDPQKLLSGDLGEEVPQAPKHPAAAPAATPATAPATPAATPVATPPAPRTGHVAPTTPSTEDTPD